MEVIDWINTYLSMMQKSGISIVTEKYRETWEVRESEDFWAILRYHSGAAQQTTAAPLCNGQ